jgi:subtilisin
MAGFEKFLDMEHLREVMTSATGKGVKVAILDTGVESSHPHLGDCVKACYDVVPNSSGSGGFETKLIDEGNDFMGHGTACAGIIHDLVPEAELYSVRVIGSGLGDTSDKLIEGVKFALEQDWPIINLSLGTQQFNRQLFRLAERASYDGKILIASKDNQHGKVGYPAALSAVIGVDMDHFDDVLQFRYRMGEEVELEAKGIYIKAPSPGGGYELYTGTSFACPAVAGIAARFMDRIEGLTSFQLRTVLAAMAEKKSAEPET